MFQITWIFEKNKNRIRFHSQHTQKTKKKTKTSVQGL